MFEHEIFKYADMNMVELDNSWEGMIDGGAPHESTTVKRILYIDTDSNFLSLYELFLAYFDRPEDEFKQIVMKFSDKEVEKLGINKQVFIDLITEVTDYLSKFVNDVILVDFKNRYNVTDEFNHLDFKSEFIFSAMYLLMKKVYTYRQIAERGVIDEKFASSNLGVKSDKSELTNKVINNLSKLILTQPTLMPVIQQTKAYIHHFRKLIEARDHRTAVPASISKSIDEYEKNHETARSALVFEYLTHNKGVILPGTKGKLYMINNINWRLVKDSAQVKKDILNDLRERWGIKDIRSALTSIFIPEIFEDKFNYDIIEVNKDAQLVKVLLKPLQQIFTPLNINVAEIANVDSRLFK